MQKTTAELVKNAQQREYTQFDLNTKDILAQKVAQKMQETGYIDRLDQAQNKNTNESLNEDKADYKKVYDAELAKFDGAKSPADLSKEDKIKFFDAVDAAYKAPGEKPEKGE